MEWWAMSIFGLTICFVAYQVWVRMRPDAASAQDKLDEMRKRGSFDPP